MSDLLKEAIADAKAVRETALQNAKMALEEAFTPQIKSMLSAKLREDEFEDDDPEEMSYEDEEMGDEEEEVPAETAYEDEEFGEDGFNSPGGFDEDEEFGEEETETSGSSLKSTGVIDLNLIPSSLSSSIFESNELPVSGLIESACTHHFLL